MGRRLVIDSNQLQSPRLRAFLSKSADNFAVLTDYVAMEAHQIAPGVLMPERMAVLTEFPRQVLILKCTREVCALRGRKAGLQRRLIDQPQTAGFGTYAANLRASRLGNVQLRGQLDRLGAEAREHLGTMLSAAAGLPAALHELAQIFTQDERRVLRLHEPFSRELIDKITRAVLELTAIQFRDHPNVQWRPDVEEIPNTFIFRATLCAYLLALRRVALGGSKDARPEKLRNDLVDATFSAYGTYFDGILSADQKLVELHQEARLYLAGLFDCELPGGLLSRGDRPDRALEL